MARDEISRNLAAINEQITSINASLKTATTTTNSLAKSLRLNPKNVQLAATYSDSLAKKVELARQKVDLLKQKQQEMARSNPTATTTKEYEKLTTQIVQAESEVRVLNRRIAETNNTKLSNLQSGLSGISRACKVILTSVIAIGVAFAATGDEIDKNSKKFGLSAEEYQKWANVFDRATGSSTSYITALKSMTSLMGQVEKGTGKMLVGLELLGVSLDEFKGKGPQELLEFILNLLQGIDDEDERLAAAASIFGTYGADLSTVAALTTSEIAELNEELARAGIITSEQAEKAAALKDAFDDLKNTFKAAMVEVGESLIPVFKSLISILKAFVPILYAVASFLNLIGPYGQLILITLIAIVAILPTVAGLIKAVNIVTATLNVTVGALLVKLLIIAGVIIAIGLLLTAIFGKSYSLDIDTSSADHLLEGTDRALYGSSAEPGRGGTINNVTYNDYSTTNVTAETEVELDDIIDGLNSKVIQVGGK